MSITQEDIGKKNTLQKLQKKTDEKLTSHTCCMPQRTTGSVSCFQDESSDNFAVSGFFFPLVGLILYLIYESSHSNQAKSFGKGVLIEFITKPFLSIVVLITV